MPKLVITATSQVSSADVASARLGTRFGRMDLSSQLALLAVEPFATHFDSIPRDRIAIILAARAGSLPTDVEYWKGRNAAGGPSPTLFTYTLPSAAIGEIAIRHRLTGPGLCFVGASGDVLPEAADLLRRDEVEGCVCVFANVISPPLAEMIPATPAASACAVFLQRGAPNSDSACCDPAARRAGSETRAPQAGVWHELGEFDRDMESLCANLRG